jgi:hypothetical protein
MGRHLKQRCRTVTLIGCVALAFGALGCDMHSGSNAEQFRKAQARLAAYDQQQAASGAEQNKNWNAMLRQEWESAGDLTAAESDARSLQLQSPYVQQRINAAVDLGHAKGKRPVPALMAALHRETHPGAFIAIVEALQELDDKRASDTLQWALNAPGIPDTARLYALRALNEAHSLYRMLPEVKEFYASATDESVRGEAATILRQFP